MTEYKSKTFFDIPSREWALTTPEAQFLQRTLPTELSTQLETLFLRTGLNSPEAKNVLSYVHKHSEITKSVRNRPSDAIPFEQIYRKMPPTCAIDEFYIRSKGAMGIYLRLLSLKDNLPHIIRQEIEKANLSRHEKFIVLNAGSGPSHDMIEVLHENPDLASRVRVFAVDFDRRSLDIGEKRAASLGLEASFTFISDYLEKIPALNAHLIIVIGILCPLTSRMSTRILRSIKSHSRQNGLIIYSTVQEEMIYGDPLLDVFMRGMNWTMDYKTDAEAERIGQASGLSIEGAFYDVLKYNRMTLGRLNGQNKHT
jgi:hypothetical protein